VEGNVLEAFVAAMLYDTVGPALLATLQLDQFQSTSTFTVNFLRPVRPGRVVGKGRVGSPRGRRRVPRGVAARRPGDADRTATAIARVIPPSEARSAA
jgi:acyl-coenzyme A thioesterase PaaI-like protein